MFSYEWFVARRYLRVKRKINLITIIAVISTIGITIGVSALICVLSVFNGFNGVVKNLLVSFDPHIKMSYKNLASNILLPQENNIVESGIIKKISRIPQVQAVSGFAEGKSAIITQLGLKIIKLQGIEKKDIMATIGLGEFITRGEFKDYNETDLPALVLGAGLIYDLNVHIGDTVSVLSQSGLEQSLTQAAPPQIIKCIISGVFTSNNKDYDSYLAFINIVTAKEMFGDTPQNTGLYLRLQDFNNTEQVVDLLRKNYPNFTVETWQDLHKELFSVMEIERIIAYFILLLIVIVAVFNMLGSLTMTVIEKQRDIGIMKTMGSDDKSIRKIFMFQGLFIGIAGTILGTGLGLLVCFLQIKYGLFQLDNSIYIIPAIPVQIRLPDVLIVMTSSLLLSALATIYPARRAERILPADAIRWE